eukprot:Platyproteum_vivax@DN3179_c0_g1_i1.p1
MLHEGFCQSPLSGCDSDVYIADVKWDEYRNVEKIQIGEKWHDLQYIKDTPISETGLVQMKQAMRMCQTWPKALQFENTGLNATFGKDVANIINEHPSGFERIYLWSELGLKNDGLKAILDNLNASALQNVKIIHLHCGLSGEEGGHLIHTMLQKCGNSLLNLDIVEELGSSGLVAAFSPFNDSKRKIKIDTLSLLRKTGVSKEAMPSLLKNCEVTTLKDTLI